MFFFLLYFDIYLNEMNIFSQKKKKWTNEEREREKEILLKKAIETLHLFKYNINGDVEGIEGRDRVVIEVRPDRDSLMFVFGAPKASQLNESLSEFVVVMCYVGLCVA